MANLAELRCRVMEEPRWADADAGRPGWVINGSVRVRAALGTLFLGSQHARLNACSTLRVARPRARQAARVALVACEILKTGFIISGRREVGGRESKIFCF